MLYQAGNKGPYHVAGIHDKDSKRLIGIIFRPATWGASTVYYQHDADNYDVIIPTIFTGMYHYVKNPGKSGGTEPTTWATEVGGETVDGITGLVWVAQAYNLMVPSETITAVTYSGTDGIIVTNTSNTTTSCQFMIPVLPAAAIATGTFEITTHFTKSNLEEGDVTLHFKIGNR